MSDKMREAFKVAFQKAASEDVDYDEAVDRGLAAALTAQAEQHGGVSGWYCAHCQHGVDPVDVTFGEKHVYCGYPVTDCPAPPAPVTPDDVVKDAARYRWLRDQDYDDGCVIAMKEKHIPRFVNYSQAIDDYIDAAMLSAAPEVKP